MAENFFAMIDRVKRNIRKNAKNPEAMIEALELALIRGREDFNADPVGATLESANLGGLSGLAGIVVGPGSKTWNKVAAKAFEDLEKQGLSNKEAYLQTGTYRAPDNTLRQEIDDSQATILSKLDERAKQLTGRNEYYGAGGGLGGLFATINHPLLKEAYPKMDENISPLVRFGDGIVDEGSLNDVGRLVVRSGDEEGARSIAMHELQHAIQQREGFARGGSPEEMAAEIKLGYPEDVVKEARILRMFLDSEQARNPREAAKMYESMFGRAPNSDAPRLAAEYSVKTFDADLAMNPKAAFDRYQSLAGEAESRMVQKRLNLPMSERLKRFPLEDYDVPLSGLIIRK